MKTIEEVVRMAQEISVMAENGLRLGEIYKSVCSAVGPVTGAEFLRVSRVADGECLPEVALLDCPAANNLCQLSVTLQKKHVINRQPFQILRISGDQEWVEQQERQSR